MVSARKVKVSLYWTALVCSIVAAFSMILAFSTPYWIQSWRRVHSPFANTGMWTICLSGYIKPNDPTLSAYVGCWWIHTSVFHDISNAIMPPWFRAVQFFVIITTLSSVAVLIILILFRFDNSRQNVYGERPWKMLYIVSIISFVTALFIFIDSMIFSIKTIEASWMPRPYLNYLSWSFGFNVLCGFFSAFSGICTFYMAMLVHESLTKGEASTEEEREAGVDNAGVTVSTTPPPPKVMSLPAEKQPPPQMYAQPGIHGSPVVHPYSQGPMATYAYQRRSQPLESTDTEV